MSEFIGARISLVSNSDIRYVGTLHEINSETSTVALENVSMLGTEGRRPDNEVAALDSVYEYILFRGTDVKDLRIEESSAPKEPPKPPQIPHDPAILGSRSRPAPPIQPHSQYPPQVPSLGLQGAPSFGQYPNYYPPPDTWNRGGPPGLGCIPAMPYGGWHPGSQQAFAHGPQYLPHGYPPGPSTSLPLHQNSTPSNPTLNINSGKNKPVAVPLQPSTAKPEKLSENPTLPHTSGSGTAQVSNVSSAVSKLPIHKSDGASSSATTPSTAAASSSKMPATNSHKNHYRLPPAVPVPNVDLIRVKSQVATGMTNIIETSTVSERLRGATEAAAAAVSAAILKLPAANTTVNGVEDLTKKVRDLEMSSSTRDQKPPGKSSLGAGRSNRGGQRGARANATKVEVPKEDFDFESANAKFSKESLVKEALSDSPQGENTAGAVSNTKNAAVIYNKAASFFDNISSEAKDRQESGSLKPGGREWRGEEQKKNLETFGQESVDNGYRGGYRGRGRGRGGYRGRGYNGKRRSSRGAENHRGRAETQQPAVN